MPQPKFVVSRFKNRNGVITFRVESRLNGVRVRKNFKTREEAIAEKGALDLKVLQLPSDIQSEQTALSTELVREAKAGFQRLKGRSRSMSFYLDYALANYHDPVQDISSAQAMDDYVAMRKRCVGLLNFDQRTICAASSTVSTLCPPSLNASWP